MPYQPAGELVGHSRKIGLAGEAVIGGWNQFQMLLSPKRVVNPLDLRQRNELVLAAVDNQRWRRHLRGGLIGVVPKTIVIEAAMKRDIADRWGHGPDATPQLDRDAAIPLP